MAILKGQISAMPGMKVKVGKDTNHENPCRIKRLLHRGTSFGPASKRNVNVFILTLAKDIPSEFVK